ncbi:MAG: acetylornithine transaminase [Granulosicoccus sp.]
MASLMAAYGRFPITLTHGKGARLWDDAGREYLDGLSGIAVTALGHADPAISSAISEQAQQLLHVSNLYHIPQQEALGAALCRLSSMDKAFFCNSGAEANEACIKIARLHGHSKGIEKPVIIAMDTAFHGRTMATIAATGNAKIKKGFGPMLEGFEIVRFDDVAAIETLASTRSDIAAIIVEPIQGEGGINVPQTNYLQQLRRLCDKQNWLLICDEIQSGMGRTGKWFAHQHAGIQPDVMSLAKALGNGMPIGACLARGAAAELIQPGSHGTTFGGNPIACKVALTVIEQMESRDLVARAGQLGKRMRDGFKNRLHNQPAVRDIRGMGMMIGIELEHPCAEIVGKALEAGLLINVTADKVVRLLPPYILSDEQADDLVDRVSELIIDFIQQTEAQQTTTA